MVKKMFQNRGVTLIEMMIVIGIFTAVSTILLFNYGNFRTNVSIRNLAQEIALSVRKAQSYATSVRGIMQSGASTRDFPGYGIAFAKGAAMPDLQPDEKEFILFADIPLGLDPFGDRRYAQSNATCNVFSAGNECLEKLTISGVDRISDLQACSGSCISVDTLNVVFQRPNPDALFCVLSGGVCSSSVYSSVRVEIKSPTGQVHTISIWNTGQISVQ